MAEPVDSVLVQHAALDLAANEITITVLSLFDALDSKGLDCSDDDIRSLVADLESRRYLGFTGQWDGDEKIYTII